MNFDPQNFGDFLDAYQHYISDRRQYQAGGDAQGGGSQQAFMQQAVQAIASGQADAHDVFVQLQKMGMKKEQAAGVVEQIVTAASQLATQSQEQPTEPVMTGTAAYGGQLHQYQSDVATGNVNLTDGSTLSDPYKDAKDTVRTDHNMISNLEDTALNKTMAGMNFMGNPNSMGWALKNTGAQGFLKGAMGLASVIGGAGLGIAKFASPDKVTNTAAAPKGTMLATDKTGQQTSISPEEAKKRQSSQNTVEQPATIKSLGQQNDPTAWQKPTNFSQPGMPVFTQPVVTQPKPPQQFGYGAEVDFDHMYLPKHQSNIGTGNVGGGFSGIPYNNAGPMADGMNGQITPIQQKLDYLNKSLDLSQQPAKAPAQPVQPIPGGGAANTPKTQTVTEKTRGDAGGRQVAMNMLNGLDMLNSTIGAKKEQNIYNQNMRDAGNSDSLASTNSYNSFGMHTVNDQNALGRTPNMGAIQDIGTYMPTAANGGDIHDFGAYLSHYNDGGDMDEYAEGGEYELTEAQIRHILANGGEIEFL